jgi:hypothetical protein
MNLKKNLFAVALTASLAIPSFASATTASSEPTNVNVRSDIKKMIQRMDLDYSKYALESVKLKFMVNENNELIVISTGDSALDSKLKNGLNYKQVDTKGLKPYSIYVVQVTLKIS